MRVMLRLAVPLVTVVGLAAVVPAATPAAKSSPHVCSGTFKKPGVIFGTYKSGVVVKGACFVKSGPAKVIGNLIVTKRSALAAAFGKNARTNKGGSSLTVTGKMVVGKGATAFLGCDAESPCIDEPHMKKPTLKSHERISGGLIIKGALGVVVHNTTIGGKFKSTGGGGGVKCAPAGPFKAVHAPVFSALEDSSVGGNLTISGLKSCWLGVARVHVKGNATLTNNVLADPDAIEVVSNHIAGNLACTGNSHPASAPAFAQPVWDSAEQGNPLFPRTPQPNTVGGTRSGQCKLASPTTQGGAPGPGPF